MSPKKLCPPLPFKPLKNPKSTSPFTNTKKKKKMMMKEVAQQELNILEAHHPTRFHHLKLHLKEFIHLLDQQDDQSFKHKQHHQQQFYTSVITQESSSNRKRQREEENDDGYTNTKIRRRKGIRDAIHKAEACLHKIQTLKSLFCSSDH